MNQHVKNLERMIHSNQFDRNFPKYIKKIVFPKYKNLESGSRINFTFPLTVFVGPNGCGKSTALQALETAPANLSLSSRWFNTAVDPIVEDSDPKKPKNCFWYEYYNHLSEMDVQILNTRAKRKTKPDYWESSRPLLHLGMDPMPPLTADYKERGRTQTRWNSIEMNVLYMDFRSELSAFDKYFYFSNPPQKLRYKTKQDYIRYFSHYLREVFKQRSKSRLLRNKEKVHKHLVLPEEHVKEISQILDKEYRSASLVEHSFYKNRGFSILFHTDNIDYTEAFAGSGEMAIAKLVYQVKSAEPSSLILLDEPEVSLHPGAQKKMLSFLLKECKEKHHQIVICSHSSAIVEELPNKAIKVFIENINRKYQILENVKSELAFKYIGHKSNVKIRILVEDESAKQLLQKIEIPPKL